MNIIEKQSSVNSVRHSASSSKESAIRARTVHGKTAVKLVRDLRFSNSLCS